MPGPTGADAGPVSARYLQRSHGLIPRPLDSQCLPVDRGQIVRRGRRLRKRGAAERASWVRALRLNAGLLACVVPSPGAPGRPLEAMERIMPASPPARRHHDCLRASPAARRRVTSRSGEPPPIWLAGKKTGTCRGRFQRLGRGYLCPLLALRARPAAPPKSKQVRRTYSKPLRSLPPACALFHPTTRVLRALITLSGDGPFATASRMKR